MEEVLILFTFQTYPKATIVDPPKKSKVIQKLQL